MFTPRRAPFACLLALLTLGSLSLQGCVRQDDEDDEESREEGQPWGPERDVSVCKGPGSARSTGCVPPNVCAGGDCRPPDVGSPDAAPSPDTPSSSDGSTTRRDATEDGGRAPDAEPDPKTDEAKLDGPTTVQFGQVQPLPNSVCDRKTRVVTLRNTGGSPLEIGDARIRSSDEPFWVTYPPVKGDSEKGGDSDCKNRYPNDRRPDGKKTWPVPNFDGRLEPGEVLKVRVWFEPENTSPARASLQLDWAGTNSGGASDQHEINLIANTGTPCLQLAPSSRLDFGRAPVGQTSKRSVGFRSCSTRNNVPLRIEDVRLSDDAGGVFGLVQGSLPRPLARGETMTISDRRNRTFTVVFKPPAPNRYAGELVLETNDPAQQSVRIDLVGTGGKRANACPRAKAEARGPGSNASWTTQLRVPPGSIVDLRSKRSRDPDGSVARYEWSILQRPGLSTSQLEPGPKAANPELELDLVGTYKVELIVYDDDGTPSCGQRAVVDIEARPQADVLLQLVWKTPGDGDPTDQKGTDVDLHYVRPTSSSGGTNWQDLTNDVFWKNKNPDWGQTGTMSDGPEMQIDDTNGRGPEIIVHDNPNPDKLYKVGVHYYADRGLGPSYATVRVYLDRTLSETFQSKFLKDSSTFWIVGRLDWSNRTFITRNTVQKGFPR